MHRYTKTAKAREDNPFIGPLTTRPIIVVAGALWPIGSGEDYEIPLGTPMCPVSTTGKYRPIRRSYVVTALASSDTQIYLNSVKGFATGDVLAMFTGAASTTHSITATVTGVDYTNNIITVAALAVAATNIVTNAYVEVQHNGYLLNRADAVFLGENIQTGSTADGETWDVPAMGIIKGQVDVNRLDTNCYDALIETQISGMDYIPLTSGV